MNVVQLGAGSNAQPAPQLWLALTVSIGGTLVSGPLIYIGIQGWRKYYRRPRRERWWYGKIVDRFDLESP